jgi:hypothetical protein
MRAIDSAFDAGRRSTTGGGATSSTSATKRSVVKKPITPPVRIRRMPTIRTDEPYFSRAAAMAPSREAASTDGNGTVHHSQ